MGDGTGEEIGNENVNTNHHLNHTVNSYRRPLHRKPLLQSLDRREACREGGRPLEARWQLKEVVSPRQPPITILLVLADLLHHHMPEIQILLS
jgi:hypothetical protein